MEPAGAGQVDQRPHGRLRQLTCRTSARSIPTLHWANPPGGIDRPRHPAHLHGDARPVHRSGPDRHPRARRGRGRRRERRLRGGLVSCRTRGNIPAGYATEGTWYDFFAGKAAAGYGEHLGIRASPPSSTRTQPRPATNLVPRPLARHDPPERLRGAGGLLHRARRPRGRRRRHRHANRNTRRCCPGPAPTADDQFLGDQDLLRDPDRHPGPLVQRRRLALLSRQPRVLRRDHRSVHPGRPICRRSGTRSSSATRSWSTATPGRILDVEQRRYRFRFLNGCQSRFLILDFSADPRGRGVADRQRGRIPRRARST